MSGNWIVVASADHVRRGCAEGFVQACHGKAAPMRRIRPGDTVVCYSPTGSFGGSDRVRAFTAIGVVLNGGAYQVDMGDGFHPFRQDVAWADATQAPIEPLLDQLDFTRGKANWGYQLRFGLLAVSEHDRTVIAAAMQAQFVARSP